MRLEYLFDQHVLWKQIGPMFLQKIHWLCENAILQYIKKWIAIEKDGGNMAKVLISPGKYVQGAGEMKKLGVYAEAYGTKALILISEGG